MPLLTTTTTRITVKAAALITMLSAAGRPCKNPAYDYFPCQHQLYYRGKGRGQFWYEPVFKAITLDGREVWRRRVYRVRRAKRAHIGLGPGSKGFVAIVPLVRANVLVAPGSRQHVLMGERLNELWENASNNEERAEVVQVVLDTIPECHLVRLEVEPGQILFIDGNTVHAGDAAIPEETPLRLHFYALGPHTATADTRLPWTPDGRGLELWDTTQLLLGRHDSDNFLFVYLVLINQYVTAVPQVADTTKGFDLKSLACMIANCGSKIMGCVQDATCKSALDCLNSCTFNDQVCQYRCIVSYESPLFEAFSLCILQLHNCRGLDAKPPLLPGGGAKPPLLPGAWGPGGAAVDGASRSSTGDAKPPLLPGAWGPGGAAVDGASRSSTGDAKPPLLPGAWGPGRAAVDGAYRSAAAGIGGGAKPPLLPGAWGPGGAAVDGAYRSAAAGIGGGAKPPLLPGAWGPGRAAVDGAYRSAAAGIGGGAKPPLLPGAWGPGGAAVDGASRSSTAGIGGGAKPPLLPGAWGPGRAAVDGAYRSAAAGIGGGAKPPLLPGAWGPGGAAVDGASRSSTGDAKPPLLPGAWGPGRAAVDGAYRGRKAAAAAGLPAGAGLTRLRDDGGQADSERMASPGTFHLSVLDNGVTSNEYWRILDCDEGLAFCLFYYSGAAATAGLAYSGAVLGTADGAMPGPQHTARLHAALARAGIQPWELSYVDNSGCADAPLGITGPLGRVAGAAA
ncbi:hypothetical protein TSOC_007988 [Tetrabaena socialis]|uniref:VDE lipocalin domain-containing protein n=1 Tax=Tetrabaena socialis TaxID=47790 RepID=A0A2J7ZZQ9_9CHLO|nr:hypothetical protein TSOC_007988 [Tetrabaena socialis]|eukprot:PNH05728.1 hypothetical protein TSOC_007988 [Tetrabaena socialis]